MKFELSTLLACLGLATGCTTPNTPDLMSIPANRPYIVTAGGEMYPAPQPTEEAPRMRCSPRTRCITLQALPASATRSATNRSIDQLFASGNEQFTSGQGFQAGITYNGFFQALRTACDLGTESCRDACNRRSEMRQHMRDWNRWSCNGGTNNGRGQCTTLTWDDDIDGRCINVQ